MGRLTTSGSSKLEPSLHLNVFQSGLPGSVRVGTFDFMCFAMSDSARLPSCFISSSTNGSPRSHIMLPSSDGSTFCPMP